MKKVLIVGAGGFIGGFLAAEALRRGCQVWCGVRPTTSRRYLTDPELKFTEFDYDDAESLAQTLESLPQFDWVVYNLGATKCINFLDFNRINYDYLRTFTEALQRSGHTPSKFVYMSSLSVLGPGDERGYTPLSDSMIPAPDTRYGVSKMKAETWLMGCEWLPWVTLRPTGVYGPHEQDYLMMVKAIDSGFDFGVGYRRQMLTFIYVEDLARAAFDALEKAPAHEKYIISEPRAYTQAEFRSITAQALGRRLVVPVKLPLWIVRIASAIAGKYGIATMKATTLNPDKYKIMKQRNWACDTSKASRDFGFTATTTLPQGMTRVVETYRAAKAASKAKGGQR